MNYTVCFMPDNIKVSVMQGTTLQEAQIKAGLAADAPCGGNGRCGKCEVIADGIRVLACRTAVECDMTVYIPQKSDINILTDGISRIYKCDRENKYALAFDVGTSTIAAYLLDGESGQLLATSGALNPQTRYGADVISRIQYATEGKAEELKKCILPALCELASDTAKIAGISIDEITVASIAANTAMHHLMLGIDTVSLVTPPYMPKVFDALEISAKGYLPITGYLRMLPNIAGFVGGDTVGCMTAIAFDKLEELSLMIDIGTNGEIVLGDKNRHIVCSAAAGPAFEGANISCGMRSADGAVDRVWQENGKIRYHVIGETKPKGLCGSGLIDLAALLLDIGEIDETGYMPNGCFALCDTEIVLTAKDVRELQLAKAAVRTGIDILTEKFNISSADIKKVYLAGAFGNHLTPSSACRIGMIPSQLEKLITSIGNAAGEGAKLCAISREEFDHAKKLAKETEFIDLAADPHFQERYAEAMYFGNE